MSTSTTETTTTQKWLAAWARATLLHPSCAGPTGALALWRSLRNEEVGR